jgi:hypothetical protein
MNAYAYNGAVRDLLTVPSMIFCLECPEDQQVPRKRRQGTESNIAGVGGIQIIAKSDASSNDIRSFPEIRRSGMSTHGGCVRDSETK